ncbi:MAG: holo-ACP synthase [Clostridia bacterium]|nr:holo-ACP synthase [Clostridia bacterium]
MFAVGTDIIEIQRIKKSMKNKKFFEYVFGEEEYKMLESKNLLERSVAANFCAKEAFFKSIGTGIRGYGLKNVQVLRDELGKPYFKFSGKLLELVNKNKYKFSVSLSHSKEYALATVLCYTE